MPRSNSSNSSLDRPLDGPINKDDEYHSLLHAEEKDYEDRRGFVKKVYGILATQLTITFGWTGIVVSSTDLTTSMRTDAAYGALIGCSVLAMVIQCALLCCMKVARKSPTNYILLFGFTACWTFIVGAISAQYDPNTVLTAALLTALITVTLSVYACFTKTDFTAVCGPFLCFGLMIICTMSIIMSIICWSTFSYPDWWIPFAAGFCAILYGMFLLYDTQLIVGGHKYELSLDDYIVGALILYIDIIMLFIELLRFMGGRK